MTAYEDVFYGFGPYDGDVVGPITYDPVEALKFDNPIIQYYISLLIIQYINRPRARQTVGLFVQEAIANGIILAASEAFNLDVAVGKQLDALAAYRGASRIVFGLDLTRAYFSFALYADADPSIYPGFALYADDMVADYWLLYADADRPIYSMTDDELRRFVKFLAKTESRFLSIQEIDGIIFEFFGNYLSMTDNGDMTVTYTHNPADMDNLFKIVEGTKRLPAPAGVKVLVA